MNPLSCPTRGGNETITRIAIGTSHPAGQLLIFSVIGLQKSTTASCLAVIRAVRVPAIIKMAYHSALVSSLNRLLKLGWDVLTIHVSLRSSFQHLLIVHDLYMFLYSHIVFS